MSKPFQPTRRQSLASTALGLVRDPLAGELIALEPRIVFDGAALAVAVEAAKQTTAADADTGDHTAADHDTSTGKAAADVAKLSAALAASPAAETSAATSPRQVIFIDSRVPDRDAFKATAGSDALVVVVDAAEDGLSAISRTLSGLKDVVAVHIVSHGTQGAFSLGRDWVDTQALKAREADIQGWATSLSADADILLYGCDVAGGDKGSAFVAELARDTGADVAASTDTVGKTDAGTDWSLEKTTGTIEATRLAPEGYGHELSTLPVSADQSPLTLSDNVLPRPASVTTEEYTLARGVAYNGTTNWTNDNTPTLKGVNAVADSTMRLYTVNATTGARSLVASTTADAFGNYALTPGTALPDGPVKMVVTAQEPNKAESTASETAAPNSTFWLNIDTLAPTALAPIGTSATSTGISGLGYEAGTDTYVSTRTTDILNVTLTQELTEALRLPPAAAGQVGPVKFTILVFSEYEEIVNTVKVTKYALQSSREFTQTLTGNITSGRATVGIPNIGNDLSEFRTTSRIHLYVADAAGNFRDANGQPVTGGNIPTGPGAAFNFRYAPITAATISNVTDDLSPTTGPVAPGGVTNDKTIRVTIDGLVAGNTYRLFTRAPGNAGNTTYTIGPESFGNNTSHTFDVNLTTNYRSDGTAWRGTWSLELTTDTPSGSSAPATRTVTLDPNPLDFEIVDAFGEKSDPDLQSGDLVDGVTIRSKDTALKAPGTTVTLTINILTGNKSANGSVSYVAERPVTTTVRVGSDGRWAYALPASVLGFGLKKISVTAVDQAGNAPPAKTVGAFDDPAATGIYVTSAWTPGGLGVDGLTGWYDASASYRVGTDTKGTLQDLSGNAQDGRLFEGAGFTSTNPVSTATVNGQKVLTLATSLSRNPGNLAQDGVLSATTGFTLASNVSAASIVYAGDVAQGNSGPSQAVSASWLTPLRQSVDTSLKAASNRPTGFYNDGSGGAAVVTNTTQLTPTGFGPSTGWVNGIITQSGTGSALVANGQEVRSGGYTAGSYNSIGTYFTGRLGTVVSYSRSLNAAERAILSNGLSERYGTSLATGVADLFRTPAGTTNKYATEIGGIAQAPGLGSTTDRVVTASNGGLVITNGTGTDGRTPNSGSFLQRAGNASASILFGNNNESGEFTDTDAAGNKTYSSMKRQWAVDIRSTSPGINSNNGTVDVSIDVASLYSTTGKGWSDVERDFGGRQGMSLAWRASETDKWTIIAASDSEVTDEGGKIIFRNVVVNGTDKDGRLVSGLRNGFVTLLDGPSIVGISGETPTTLNQPEAKFTVTTSERIVTRTSDPTAELGYREDGIGTDSFVVKIDRTRDNAGFENASIKSVRELGPEKDANGNSTGSGRYQYEVIVEVGEGSGYISVDYDFSSVTGVDSDGNPLTPVVDDSGNVIKPASKAGNAVLDTSYSGSQTFLNFDTRPPAPTITLGRTTVGLTDATAPDVAEPSTVTITFDEAPFGFTGMVQRDGQTGDVAVEGGTLTDFVGSDPETRSADDPAPLSGTNFKTWTATFTPTLGITRPDARITVLGATGQFRDKWENASNRNTVATFAIDTVRPKVTSIAPPDGVNATTNAGTIDFIVTFDEAMNAGSVNASDFVVTGPANEETTAVVTRVQAESSDNKKFRVTVADDPNSQDQARPLASYNKTVGLALADNPVLRDAAGNLLTSRVATTTTTYLMDNNRPTVSASLTAGGTSVKAGEMPTVRFAFSDVPVFTTSRGPLTAADFTITSGFGTLSAPVISEDGKTVDMTYTPLAGTPRGKATIALAASTAEAISDTAGNPLVSSPLQLTVDTQRPTITDVSLPAGVEPLTNANSLAFEVTFSEDPATSGPGAVDGTDFVLKYADGAFNGYDIQGVSAAVTATGTDAKRTVTFTGGGIDTYTGKVRLALKSGRTIEDPTGNPLSGDFPAGVDPGAYTYELDNRAGLTVGPYATATTNQTPTFSGTADPDVEKVELLNGTILLGTATPQDGSWTITSSTLTYNDSTPYDLTLRATDALGNIGLATVSVLVSALPQPARITAIVDGFGLVQGDLGTEGRTDDTTPILKGEAPEGSTVKLYKVVDGEAVPVPGTITVTQGQWTKEVSPGEGTHAYYATSITNGQESNPGPTFTFTIDTTRPARPTLGFGAQSSGGVTSDATPTLSGIASNGSTVSIYNGSSASPIASSIPVDNGIWTWTPTTALADAVYSLRAMAINDIGVESLEYSPAYELTIDTVRPSLSEITPNAISANGSGTQSIDFVFSEPLNQSTVSKDAFTVSGDIGTLSDTPAFSSDGKTATFTFTPTSGVDDRTGSVSLAGNADIRDLAGNAVNLSGTPSASIAIDTRAPDIIVPAGGLSVRENSTTVLGGKLTSDETVTFSLDEASDLFSIGADGTVTVKGTPAFDYEASPDGYTLKVKATDGFGNTATKDVTIAIIDVNEAPTGVVLAGVEVTSDDKGAVAGRLSAVDPDRGPGQSFTFSTSDPRFQVAGDVLRLKPGVSLSAAQPSVVRVPVTVTDQGGLAKTVEVEVKVVPAPFVPGQAEAAVFVPPATQVAGAFPSSRPVETVRTRLETLLNGTQGQVLEFSSLSRAVSTVTLGADGRVLGPGTTGSFGDGAAAGLIDISSALRSSFIDITINYFGSTADFSLLDERAPEVASVSVQVLDGANPALVTISNGRLLVSRAEGGTVRIAVETRLKTGEVLNKIITVNTRTGTLEVASPPSSGAALHGPSFDAQVTSMLQGHNAWVNGLASAFL